MDLVEKTNSYPKNIFEGCLKDLLIVSDVLKREVIERGGARYNDQAKAKLVLSRVDEAIFYLREA
jgi:hypothetical protein